MWIVIITASAVGVALGCFLVHGEHLKWESSCGDLVCDRKWAAGFSSNLLQTFPCRMVNVDAPSTNLKINLRSTSSIVRGADPIRFVGRGGRWLKHYEQQQAVVAGNRLIGPLHSPNLAAVGLSLQWRHIERYGVSNHQRLHCLLSCWFRRRSTKTSKLRVTDLCVGIHRWPVISRHKKPVTRKMFPFDDVIICGVWDMACDWMVLPNVRLVGPNRWVNARKT